MRTHRRTQSLAFACVRSTSHASGPSRRLRNEPRSHAVSERPEYRILYATLADDADVHALSGDAFKLLIMLKLSLPATGLGVIYPSKLCDQVGCDRGRLETILAELEMPKPGRQRGWIRRDRNIVWITNALAFESGLTPANANHVKYVRKLVASVDAKSQAVAEFRDFYPAWFQHLPKPIRRGSKTRETFGDPFTNPIGIGSGSKHKHNNKYKRQK